MFFIFFQFFQNSGSENVQMLSTLTCRKSTDFKFRTTKLKLDANNFGISMPISKFDRLIFEFSKNASLFHICAADRLDQDFVWMANFLNLRVLRTSHGFREIQGFTPQKSKNDFSHELSQSPRYRYYSSANRSTSHMKIGDRGDPVFFGHVYGRLLAYFGHGDAF